MNDHPSYPWDHHSDQPHVIKDKKLKHKIYLRSLWYLIKSVLLLLLLPVLLPILLVKKSWKARSVDRCIGLSIHIESERKGKTVVPLADLKELVDELQVNQLLVRIPLADFENIDRYIEHIDALSNEHREITVNILQSRLLLDDPVALKQAIHSVISRLTGKVEYIHVGNAYNRRKWGFYHFGEYFKFFQTVRTVCDEVAPKMKLIGGSVIDFEPPSLLESLFHFRKGHYDGYASQLYVDRRGAPENTQFKMNFLGKINFIELIRQCSWKAKGSLWISEMNWPLKNAGKFAPCNGDALVDEQAQADYLTRAYLLSIASGRVRTCYWHQLIAPGYGLVDNRGNKVIKRPSYEAFKTLNRLYNDADVLTFDNGNHLRIKGLYSISCKKLIDGKMTIIQAFWSNSGEHKIECTKGSRLLNQSGNPIELENDTSMLINSSVVYLLKSD